MAHYTISIIVTFLSIICYPHTTQADQIDTEIREPYPSLGSLVSNHGTVHFIAGVMIATVKLESNLHRKPTRNSLWKSFRHINSIQAWRNIIVWFSENSYRKRNT